MLSCKDSLVWAAKWHPLKILLSITKSFLMAWSYFLWKLYNSSAYFCIMYKYITFLGYEHRKPFLHTTLNKSPLLFDAIVYLYYIPHLPHHNPIIIRWQSSDWIYQHNFRAITTFKKTKRKICMEISEEIL